MEVDTIKFQKKKLEGTFYQGYSICIKQLLLGTIIALLVSIIVYKYIEVKSYLAVWGPFNHRNVLDSIGRQPGGIFNKKFALNTNKQDLNEISTELESEDNEYIQEYNGDDDFSSNIEDYLDILRQGEIHSESSDDEDIIDNDWSDDSEQEQVSSPADEVNYIEKD
ncbi:uncharacterized protein CMU_028520 [Cryptosporidium muris RN66]|uniref:Uncharacterized protein n=1 Tax=Cryptosporidium muris (strain RN66) TaxID=441375 RepID=B6AHT7_CRYMR|nr:uncharacterized protein CMU_028520 [Cryptosporidium muris RN66]EEA07778.1 hypothetical protein CMU_028520 [Cryptosporidium muris RN66]|eukprot:XP_002142127.1 hypothetical protein [Cryptosporidium muris RN66]